MIYIVNKEIYKKEGKGKFYKREKNEKNKSHQKLLFSRV